MEVPAKRPRCEKCSCLLAFPYQSGTTCPPCSAGQDASQLSCLLCGLQGGELTRAQDGHWIHTVCGFLAFDISDIVRLEIPQKRRFLGPPDYIQVNLPPSALVTDCVKCAGQTPAYALTCAVCSRQIHFSCLLRSPDWTYSSSTGLECGCQASPSPKPAKKPKKLMSLDYEPIRAPVASSVLKSVFEDVIRLDEYRLFRLEAANRPVILPDKLVFPIQRKFVNLLPESFVVHNNEDGLYFDINISESRSLKDVKDGSLGSKELLEDLDKAEGVVSGDEPIYVADFSQYEDQLVTSLDFLYRYRVSEHYYFTARQLLVDLGKLMTGKLKLCRDLEAVKYVNWFWTRATWLILRKKRDFEGAVCQDWKRLLDQSKGVPSLLQFPVASSSATKRSYTYITDFEPVNQDQSLLTRLTTSKKVGCDGSNCSDLSQLGPFDLTTCTWKTPNQCRANRIECTSSCHCDPASCQNRQITKGEVKKLGEDVAEIPTWGFDVLTYRTILAYLRHPLSEDMHVFIGKKLPKAINRVKQDNWDMRQAAILIITEQESFFTLKEKRYAQGLLNAVDGLTSLLDPTEVMKYFRVYAKGTGVICTTKAGFRANELIVPYIGELYSPTQWYERQDITKALLKNSKTYVGQLPDFYNIWLERHLDDPEGYDVLMIDPIVKGTFGSRLSHSCTPNCGTVPMVAGGRYTIGMYAMENIEYGQELTFDYHSVTESSEEHSKAICLCASSTCRGHYLNLSKNSQLPEFFNEEHGFLARMACIVRASQGPLTAEDREILVTNHLKERALGCTPFWLQKWCAEILRAIEKEASLHEEDYERKNSYSFYLQNLVTTLDKVKYCLAQHQVAVGPPPPPLELLTDPEIMEFLWSEAEGSIRHQLKTLYSTIYVDYYPAVTPFLTAECDSLEGIRYHLLQLRDFLKNLGKDEWSCQGIADMLHLIAFTRFWVRQNQYNNFNSSPVAVRFCDITSVPPAGKTLEDVWMSDKRPYSSAFVEGAMAGWYKQTVEKPHASLSSDKRGSMCLPNLDTVISGLAGTIYTPTMRSKLLSHLSTRPQQPWPSKVKENEGNKSSWNHYHNQAKIQGSPMLDSAILQDSWEHIGLCLRDIDLPAEQLRERIQTLSHLRSNG